MLRRQGCSCELTVSLSARKVVVFTFSPCGAPVSCGFVRFCAVCPGSNGWHADHCEIRRLGWWVLFGYEPCLQPAAAKSKDRQITTTCELLFSTFEIPICHAHWGDTIGGWQTIAGIILVPRFA